MPLIIVTMLWVSLLSPTPVAPPPKELVLQAIVPFSSPTDIPLPHEFGRPGPQPPLMMLPTHIRPEAIRGWVNNLGSESFHLREEAEEGLSSASWDGYQAAHGVLARSECAESRARAANVCRRYLGSANLIVMATRFVPYKPAEQSWAKPVPAHYRALPKIYTLCSQQKGSWGNPPNQYTLAVVCHYYTLKAVRLSWESSDESRSSFPEWGPDCLNYETLATHMMVSDMLAVGFDPLWVRWLLDDMDARQNYWPPALKRPPGWLLNWVGVKMITPFP